MKTFEKFLRSEWMDYENNKQESFQLQMLSILDFSFISHCCTLNFMELSGSTILLLLIASFFPCNTLEVREYVDIGLLRIITWLLQCLQHSQKVIQM